MASYLKKKRPDLKVVLYLHNDPRDMKGSRSSAERRHLLRAMSAVICVSDYIRDCFLDGIDRELSLIHISEPTRRIEISYAVFCAKWQP